MGGLYWQRIGNGHTLFDSIGSLTGRWHMIEFYRADAD